jgi:hypothetical protein
MLIFSGAKSELIRLRIAEKQRHLIPLGKRSATWMKWSVCLYRACRASRPGVAVVICPRRVMDQAVYDLRLEITEAATKLADQRGEPPLDEGA